MKKVIQIIGIILLIPLIYLVFAYNKNDGWNKTEQLVFAIILVIGLINSLMLWRTVGIRAEEQDPNSGLQNDDTIRVRARVNETPD
jgi:hypothetical protein